MQAFESEQRVTELRTSHSGAGGGSASPGQRLIASAFAVGKVHVA
jgi:hypothetical protein